MLGIDQIKHIANLARIGISDDEVEKFQQDLDSILGYVEKLKEVDASGIEAVSHITGLENEVRGDLPVAEPSQGAHPDREVLIGMAPEVRDGYVKVGQVLAKFK